jgi:hypothetical protein
MRSFSTLDTETTELECDNIVQWTVGEREGERERERAVHSSADIVTADDGGTSARLKVSVAE